MTLGIQDLGRTLKQDKTSGISSSAEARLFMACAKVIFCLCKCCLFMAYVKVIFCLCKCCLFMAYAKVTFCLCKYCVSLFQITYSQSKSKLKYVVLYADLHFMLQHIEIKVSTYN